MYILQNRTEPDSDNDLQLQDGAFESDPEWENAGNKFNKYFQNKANQDKVKSQLYRKANASVPLSQIIFNYNIHFEQVYAPSGWTHKACCPFPDHNDATPSFWYNSKEQRFNCFGCKECGGSVQFIAALTKQNHYEVALDLLSKNPNLDLIIADIEDSDIKITKLLLDFYKEIHNFLQSNPNNKALKHIEKITWNLDMYLEKNTMDGFVVFEALESRIEKLRELLNEDFNSR